MCQGIPNNDMPCPNHNMQKMCNVEGCTNLGRPNGCCNKCGGYRRKPRCNAHSPHNYKLRMLYKKYRKTECEICGIDKKQVRALTVHHIDHNRENNDPSNLMTLCRDCHDNEHDML